MLHFVRCTEDFGNNVDENRKLWVKTASLLQLKGSAESGEHFQVYMINGCKLCEAITSLNRKLHQIMQNTSTEMFSSPAPSSHAHIIIHPPTHILSWAYHIHPPTHTHHRPEARLALILRLWTCFFTAAASPLRDSRQLQQPLTSHLIPAGR